MRTESESMLRQLLMLQIGSVLFRSGTLRLRGSLDQHDSYAALGVHVS